MSLVRRFQGNVGDRYTIECPHGCSQANTRIYGCGLGPYMDDSSICMAAVGLKLIGDDTGGVVTIELVEPVAEYKACQLRGFNDLDKGKKSGVVHIETMKWIWWKWRWAERPGKISHYCPADWVSNNPGVPCQRVLEKYRADCKVTMGITNCFGLRAFKFIEPAARPNIDPEKGVFEDSAVVTVTPGKPDPSTFIVCTTDGTAPDASSAGKMPALPPDGIINLTPGNYSIQCQAATSLNGPSRYARAKIDVLPRLPLPDIDPDTGSTFVEEVIVSIDSGEEGVKIFYTTDGSDPTTDSEEYTEPFSLDTIGTNTIKAISQKVEWADSHVATSEITLLERVAEPSFEPYMGAFTSSVTVQILCETAGAKIHYTIDGSAPNAASPEYEEGGLILGLDGSGNEATYVIKAIAILAPDMGDSFVATSGRIVVQPPVATPVITPDSPGPYKGSVEVSVACDTASAAVRFTTDGSGLDLSWIYLPRCHDPRRLTSCHCCVNHEICPQLGAFCLFAPLPCVLHSSLCCCRRAHREFSHLSRPIYVGDDGLDDQGKGVCPTHVAQRGGRVSSLRH